MVRAPYHLMLDTRGHTCYLVGKIAGLAAHKEEDGEDPVSLVHSTILCLGWHLVGYSLEMDHVFVRVEEEWVVGSIPTSGGHGYLCRRCGQYHEGPPLSYGSSAPYYWHLIPEQERARRAILSADQGILDDEQFFIVGNIELPILGAEEIFSWTVWVSLSRANFERAAELWNTPGRESEPPYFGWLGTRLPLYPDTLNLKTHVHTQPVGIRPWVELEPTDHPLAVEQREGVTWERVQEIAELLLHNQEDFL